MVSEPNGAMPAVVRANLSQTDYKRSLAYKYLGIDPRDVQCTAFFRTDLKRIARLLNRNREKGELHDSRIRPLELLWSCNDLEARKVLNVYLSVPQSYRRLLPLEAFCHAAAVSPWRILECIAAVAVRQEGQASAVIAAALHVGVVEKMVERALQDGGFRECLMLSKAVGFVPTWGWKGL
jgi:hypothetical protein